MSQEKYLDQQQLDGICDVLGNTSQGLTKSQLRSLLMQCEIPILDDGSSSNIMSYKLGLNKSKWLFNCFAEEINTSQSYKKIYLFIQKALAHVSYTAFDKREKYEYLLEGINKVLLFVGLMVDRSGNIVETAQSQTLHEVDQRVNRLKRALYERAIHSEVQKYCISDYLRADYYAAVFEAAKGLAERVREISGLTKDGTALFNEAFSQKDPYIIFNALITESEKNEFMGLKELLVAIFHLVRNPAAHTPKINWKTDETKVLDVLTVISFAHKYLDECHHYPGK